MRLSLRDPSFLAVCAGAWLPHAEDTFTGSNGASITGRPPDTLSNGNNWTSASGGAVIDANRAAFAGVANHQLVIGANAGVAVEASVTLGTVAGTAPVAGGSTTGTERIGVRLETSGTSRYYGLEIAAGQGWLLLRNNNTTPLVIAVGIDTGVFATGTNHTVRIERFGFELRAYVDGALVYSGTDSTSTGGSNISMQSAVGTLSTKYIDRVQVFIKPVV